MKICVINNLYPPYSRGGAEIVVENQVNDFLKQGHNVFVVATRPLRDFVNSVETPRRGVSTGGRLYGFTDLW